MAITWILVANASLAKLYANLGPNKGLKLVKELVHPESRQRMRSWLPTRSEPATATVPTNRHPSQRSRPREVLPIRLPRRAIRGTQPQ